MNIKEKKEIKQIESDLIVIAGGLAGLAAGEPNRTVKELLFEKHDTLLEIHGKLVKLRKGGV